MSTSNQRRRRRRAKQRSQEFCFVRLSRQRALDLCDTEAIRESVHIKRAYYSRTMDFGINLRMTYTVDGVKFRTGQKHRTIG